MLYNSTFKQPDTIELMQSCPKIIHNESNKLNITGVCPFNERIKHRHFPVEYLKKRLHCFNHQTTINALIRRTEKSIAKSRRKNTYLRDPIID